MARGFRRRIPNGHHVFASCSPKYFVRTAGKTEKIRNKNIFLLESRISAKQLVFPNASWTKKKQEKQIASTTHDLVSRLVVFLALLQS